MKAFGIAFTLWIGTIMVSSGFLLLLGIFMVEGMAVAASFIGCFIALLVTCPLLVPATLLVKLSCKIPYSGIVQICWLGFTLILMNYLFLALLSYFFSGDWSGLDVFFYISTCALVFILFLKRTALQSFFSQQTTNKES